VSEVLEGWSRRTLASVDGLSESRLQHIAGVARRAASACGALAIDEAGLVVAAAWLHDVGYAPGLADTGCHAIDGAQHLRRQGAADEVVGLVAYHSGAVYETAERGLDANLAKFSRPPGELLDLLTFADMTTNDNGRDISIESRLDGILDRYVVDDPVHVAVDAARTHLTAAVRRVEDRLAGTRPRS